MGNLIYVDFEMVKKFIQENYPEFTDIEDASTNTYRFSTENKYGVYLSVKVPDPHTYGHAIHIGVRARMKLSDRQIRDYNVYPLDKLGTGHFKTAIIQRSLNWQKRVKEEIDNGLVLYKQKYYKSFYVFSNGYRFKYKNDFPIIKLENDMHFYAWIKRNVDNAEVSNDEFGIIIRNYLLKNTDILVASKIGDTGQILFMANNNRQDLYETMVKADKELNGSSIYDYLGE